MDFFDSHRFDFSVEEVREAAAQGRLLSAEIEFNRSCNYRCPYCYAADGDSSVALPQEVAERVIREAAALGARKIVVLGGEPLLCKQLKHYIELAGSLGMASEVFTNAALVDADWAGFFREHGCRVVVKLNSLRPEVQAELTGVPDALASALRALDLLQAAGLSEHHLAASSVICSRNEGEAAELWKYLRNRHVMPYLEIMTPQGRLLENRQLEVSPRRLEEIFREIAAFDREHGFDWEPQPPLVGAKCLRHQYSCVIGATGTVTPCVGLTTPLGSVLSEPLAVILGRSRVLRNLKDFRRKIKGPCRTCEKADSCYGCRGAAYQLTGDYLASDPLCWKNSDTLLDRPPALPCDAARYLPHRPPMVMVRNLLELGEWSVVDAVIAPDNRFLHEGVLDADAIPEIVAQACAAITGFEEENLDIRGMLTGLRDFIADEPIKAGDELRIEVCETSQIDNYYSLDFRVRRAADGVICAHGELSTCRLS